jgi:RNA polymerase sigma-70 factor (ECF subfamily)
MSPAERAITEGELRYGPLGIDREKFAAFLRQGGRAERTGAYADLALAFACGHQVPAALTQIEQHVISQLPPVLRAIDGGSELSDEVLQELRVRFFVGERPGVLTYLGRGSLAGWFKTSALRLALALARGAAPALDPQQELDALTGSVNVERMQLKAEHGPAFRAAFRAAFESLSSRERAVLRLHLVEGKSIDAIAALYTIHRATAARWVARVREVLLERTRELFTRGTKTALDEVSSLMRSLVSELDLSIERRLKES